MRNKMLERLNWKQCLQTLGNIYVKELVRVYADRRVDNTMDDTTLRLGEQVCDYRRISEALA